ncbi:hypothetical protein N1851_017368 [Merluccius polli]|uniref:Uncharacterized protein n=1 Tax=Merluccius polli TaxID=89951 RepID=A0AA47MQC7_MERPO|nr:hypothetical protein N1851_017368 [Merluccius polli]
MQQATSGISMVRIFFSDLGGFSSFFSRSPKQTSVLDEVMAHRLPISSKVRWNFHSRAVNTVDFDDKSIKEAGGYHRLLEDSDFNFLLKLFHHIMPHVDFLYAKLQKRKIDSVHINGCIQQFQKDIQKTTNSINAMVVEHSSCSDQPRKRRALEEEDHSRIAAEVCDTIMGHTKEHFAFTDHLISATLLQANRFEEYHNSFPEVALNSTLKAHPMLNGSKLRTELSPIYGKDESKSCGPFSVICGQQLVRRIFRDSHTAESPHPCPLQTFLRNTMTQDRLNALAIRSMEKKLVTEMADFNQRVINKFASLKDRRAKVLTEAELERVEDDSQNTVGLVENMVFSHQELN